MKATLIVSCPKRGMCDITIPIQLDDVPPIGMTLIIPIDEEENLFVSVTGYDQHLKYKAGTFLPSQGMYIFADVEDRSSCDYSKAQKYLFNLVFKS